MEGTKSLMNRHPAHDALAVEEPLDIQLGYGAVDARVVKSISVTEGTLPNLARRNYGTQRFY
jgi:hypothetical protein